MVVALEWPKRISGEGFGFEEIAQRHGDFAIAAAACWAHIENGTVIDISVGLGGVEDRPIIFDLIEFALHAADDPNLPDAVAEIVSQRIGTAVRSHRVGFAPAYARTCAPHAARQWQQLTPLGRPYDCASQKG